MINNKDKKSSFLGISTNILPHLTIVDAVDELSKVPLINRELTNILKYA